MTEADQLSCCTCERLVRPSTLSGRQRHQDVVVTGVAALVVPGDDGEVGVSAP